MRTLFILLVTAAILYGGAICFDIPPSATPRVAAAFGNMLGLVDANGNPRPATQQEVSDATQNWVRNTTQDYERRKNMAEFVPSPVPITATPIPSPTP